MFRRHTFAQVLDMLPDLSPNCIHLKIPQVTLFLGSQRETVLSNNLPQSDQLDRHELLLLLFVIFSYLEIVEILFIV